jgi:LEA14-like dessication related protein
MSLTCWGKLLSCRPMKTISCILSVFGFCFLFSCTQPQAPEYLGFHDFSVQTFSLDESLLHTQLSFYNPNPFTMELKRGDVNVYLDDKLANHYVLDSTINIPRKDTFYVPLNLKVNPRFLIGSALRMLMNDNKIKVRLEGSIRVKRGGISFNVPINYEVVQEIH